MKMHYLAVLALAAAAPAQALVITPLASIAEVSAETPGGADSDNDINATSVSVNASSDYTVTSGGFSATDTVTADAVQRSDGFSYIELNVQTQSGGYTGYSTASTGEQSGYGAEGKTQFVLEYYNDGAVAVTPTFNFSLSGIAADTSHSGGDDVEAEFSFDAYLLGGGDSYSASATARARYNDAEIVNQNNMSGTTQQYECSFGFCFRAAFIFDTISDSLSIGTLAPGAIATVVVEMSAKTTFNGYEQGAYARIRDPNGGPVLTYSTTFAGTPPTPNPSAVPAPATWLLVLGGLFGLRRLHAGAESTRTA